MSDTRRTGQAGDTSGRPPETDGPGSCGVQHRGSRRARPSTPAGGSVPPRAGRSPPGNTPRFPARDSWCTSLASRGRPCTRCHASEPGARGSCASPQGGPAGLSGHRRGIEALALLVAGAALVLVRTGRELMPMRHRDPCGRQAGNADGRDRRAPRRSPCGLFPGPANGRYCTRPAPCVRRGRRGTSPWSEMLDSRRLCCVHTLVAVRADRARSGELVGEGEQRWGHDRRRSRSVRNFRSEPMCS